MKSVSFWAVIHIATLCEPKYGLAHIYCGGSAHTNLLLPGTLCSHLGSAAAQAMVFSCLLTLH